MTDRSATGHISLPKHRYPRTSSRGEKNNADVDLPKSACVVKKKKMKHLVTHCTSLPPERLPGWNPLVDDLQLNICRKSAVCCEKNKVNTADVLTVGSVVQFVDRYKYVFSDRPQRDCDMGWSHGSLGTSQLSRIQSFLIWCFCQQDIICPCQNCYKHFKQICFMIWQCEQTERN